MKKPINIAMIGVGAISGIYLENITKTFHEIKLLGVCDLIRERAEKAKADYDVPKIYDKMEDAFADPEVDIILNLTRPYEHYDVSYGALMAGKHVYTEKPLGADFEEGKKLFALAAEKNLLIGGAPDTFLGGGIQTCRKLIDDGYIGEVIGAAAFLICHGHETWHPDPEFYYKRGGGPMMDMGPYYITAMINMLGGVKRLSGKTKTSFKERTITSKEHFGEVIKVDVPTHILGTLEFESGAIGTIITTFDVYNSGGMRFEVYGTKGTLYIPDPNGFEGPVTLLRPEDGKPREMPLMFNYQANSRALGLADMAAAIANGRHHRADAQQLLHVLEVLTSFKKASDEGRTIELTTKYQRNAPMDETLPKGVL